jgi:hypothetical protein
MEQNCSLTPHTPGPQITTQNIVQGIAAVAEASAEVLSQHMRTESAA